MQVWDCKRYAVDIQSWQDEELVHLAQLDGHAWHWWNVLR